MTDIPDTAKPSTPYTENAALAEILAWSDIRNAYFQSTLRTNAASSAISP